MHRGYIKIWRKLEESGLLQMPETLATMLFLILHAAHKGTKRGTKYGIIELERGQGILAIRVLAKDMNLSIQSIRTILVRLEKLEILTLKPTHSFSIYTIVNYSKYNDVSEQSTRELTNQQHTTNTPSTQEQELKHLSIKEKLPSASGDAGVEYSKAFLSFWEMYPVKKNKGLAFKSFKKIRPAEYPVIKSGLIAAKESDAWLKDNGQFIPHPSSWLNARGWEDEHTKSQQQKKAWE